MTKVSGEGGGGWGRRLQCERNMTAKYSPELHGKLQLERRIYCPMHSHHVKTFVLSQC